MSASSYRPRSSPTAQSTPEELPRRRAECADRSAEDVLGMLPALGRSLARVESDIAGWIGRLPEHGSDWTQIADSLGLTVGEVGQRFGYRAARVATLRDRASLRADRLPSLLSPITHRRHPQTRATAPNRRFPGPVRSLRIAGYIIKPHGTP